MEIIQARLRPHLRGLLLQQKAQHFMWELRKVCEHEEGDKEAPRKSRKINT
jgi:hypothetical protein